ncbi:MAG: glycosyltransferase family 2 protein [Chloroflexaceae bacterium]|nr:glycosyltransferase family 2 protein [Chloroflexaceae bacterium]
MLVFIVPLKSRRVSKSWERVCQLFERCARSICQQSSPDFQVVVVCHDRPEIAFASPRLHYLEVDFPLVKETDPVVRGLTDKGRKVLAGLVYARDRFSPDYAMTVDADDLVSSRLAEFVRDRQETGWYVDRGYKYRESAPVVHYKGSHFYRLSGTCNILHFNHLALPEYPEYNRGYGHYKFLIDHQKVKAIMADQGQPMKALPFPGSVYVLGTGDNMSANENKLFFSLLSRRPLTQKLRDEFGLYDLVEAPMTPQYQSNPV